MPFFDGTGPWGRGPGTGWGRGPCGMGLGRTYGWGGWGRPWGRGMGWRGRAWGYGPGWGYRARPYGGYRYGGWGPPWGFDPWGPGYAGGDVAPYYPTPQDEMADLKEEQSFLQSQLEAIQKRLTELETTATEE
ncbi:MAG: hypothetical protein BZ151_00955 [Desulfobacca sp. 4484_104]|nr:MAG: hypothetical protein BZ151_00955 [Desulfobacca sp. 4484_104]